MIHPKSPSSNYVSQRKKRTTHSGRTLLQSAQTVQLDERAHPKMSIDLNKSEPLDIFELLEQSRAEAEMTKVIEKKQFYPIAPDALIPNSTLRSMFKMKAIEPVEVKMFRLRLISPSETNNIQAEHNERLKRFSVVNYFDGSHAAISQTLNKINKTNRNLNWQNDDDEWVELEDPEAISNEPPTNTKTGKRSRPTTTTTRRSGHQSTIPDLFKRMQNESWWGLASDGDGDNNDLRSMLLYLIETIKIKQADSYESACNYLVEVFRTYGIEPALVNHILQILLGHLLHSNGDLLDVHTVRTISQFMIERKDVIVPLLEFIIKCQPTDILRQETINAVKFITDVNSSEDIDLVLSHMPIVYDTADDTFSLKGIIERIHHHKKKDPPGIVNDGEGNNSKPEDDLHPLLKKISEERWYPRDNFPITLDSIIDAILGKLPNASKTMLKTLTSHLVHLNRNIGYSDEQLDRILNGLISLLSHTDADHRLIAATILAELGKETKAVDIALLNGFINDPRILVRTECCDTLKKLTGITSDTVLKDCAEDISYLKTLPEENFTLQNYLNEKNRIPTPPATTTDEQSSELVDQQQGDEYEDETKVEKREQDQIKDNEKEGDGKTSRQGEGYENEDGTEEGKDVIHDEKVEQEENPVITDENVHDMSDVNVEDSTAAIHDPTNQIDDRKSNAGFRSPSPPSDEQPSNMTNHLTSKTAAQANITPSLDSSTAILTPVERPIRVEINDKQKSNLQNRQPIQKSRKDVPLPGSQTTRVRKQPTTFLDQPNRTSTKVVVNDQISGKRNLLLPNNSEMWDSYEKQHEMNDEKKKSEYFHSAPTTDINQESFFDPIQAIIDEHKRHAGYYRMRPNRQILVPHKISFSDVFGDQAHMTVDRRRPHRPSSFRSNSMELLDLNQNKRHLHDVESMQLLSSLVIRAIQVHRKYIPFIPGTLPNYLNSSSNFSDALNISQMQLHSSSLVGFQQSSFQLPKRLPPIAPPWPSSAQTARTKSDANTRAPRAGVNIRKAQDVEDVLSQLLESDRERMRLTVVPSTTPHTALTSEDTGGHDVTHAWLLESLLRSQGQPDSQNHVQQVLRTYPKFAPLLNSRIPQHLIPVIWNDPAVKKLALIIGNSQNQSTPKEHVSTKRRHAKPSIPAFDDEHSSNFFDYSASIHLTAMQQQQQRDESKKNSLPPVRGSKMRLPRHILKFGYRQLELDSPETSIESLRDQHVSKSRRRRIYMHLMCNHNHTYPYYK